MVFGWFPWIFKVSSWIFIVINGPMLVKSELSAAGAKWDVKNTKKVLTSSVSWPHDPTRPCRSEVGFGLVMMMMVRMIKNLESLQKESWSFNLVSLELHVKAKWRLLGFHYFAISLLLIFRDVINYLSKTLPGLKGKYLWGWRQSPIRKQFASRCPRSFDCSQRSSGSPSASWRRNHKTQETSHDTVRGDVGYGG